MGGPGRPRREAAGPVDVTLVAGGYILERPAQDVRLFGKGD